MVAVRLVELPPLVSLLLAVLLLICKLDEVGEQDDADWVAAAAVVVAVATATATATAGVVVVDVDVDWVDMVVSVCVCVVSVWEYIVGSVVLVVESERMS